MWGAVKRTLFAIIVGLLTLAAAVAVFRLVILFPIEWVAGQEGVLPTSLRRGGTLSSILLGYWAFVRAYERRRPVTELRFEMLRPLLGATSGAFLISLTMLVLFSTGHYQVVSFRGFHGIFELALLIVAMALLEEIVFRGLIFRIVESGFGTLFALILVSVLFGALHLFNGGATVMTLASVSLIGVLWTSIYIFTRNLWVVGLHHAAWNFTIFVSGIPLSGQEHWRHLAPIESRYNGSDLLTGGSFGPEDSIINLVVVSVAVAIIAGGIWKKGSYLTMRQAFHQAPTSHQLQVKS